MDWQYRNAWDRSMRNALAVDDGDDLSEPDEAESLLVSWWEETDSSLTHSKSKEVELP